MDSSKKSRVVRKETSEVQWFLSNNNLCTVYKKRNAIG